MGIAALKKELRQLDHEKLIALVVELYKTNKSVKAYFDFYLNPDEKSLFLAYRDRVFAAFYPRRGTAYNFGSGKRALQDFKKLSPSAALQADLHLFYVETGVNFANDFGDINETFYRSLASTLGSALTLMFKEELLPQFQARIESLVENSRDIGWGFHEYVVQLWCDFYPSED